LQYDVGTFRVNDVLECCLQLVTEQEQSSVASAFGMGAAAIPCPVLELTLQEGFKKIRQSSAQANTVWRPEEPLQETQSLLIFSKQSVRTCQRVLMLQIKIQQASAFRLDKFKQEYNYFH